MFWIEWQIEAEFPPSAPVPPTKMIGNARWHVAESDSAAAGSRSIRSRAGSFGVCFVLPRFSSEMLMKGLEEADTNLTD